MKHHDSDVFPNDFFWGASTASHQVEGNNHNQWSVWELENASELAHTAHRRLSWLPVWNEVKDLAEDPENYVSGSGIDHYRRYEEDFSLAKKMNLNAFRFGIEWSRIEPEEGVWNQEEIDHYKKYIATMRKQGLEPFFNIWHWTVPVWFAEKGGFKYRKNRKYFTRFVKKVADSLLDDVEYVITLNEPNVYTSFSYLTGEWVPEEKSPLSFMRVYWNLVQCQRDAYKILKKAKPSLQVGIAAQLANIQSKRPHNPIDNITTKWMRYFWNWWFLNRIRHSQDFVGINYYFSDYYKGFGERINPSVPVNDLGWYMEPEGLHPLLVRTWHHYKKPIYITENGLADSRDEYRRWWIEETIIAIERALSEGVQVKGYFHWSLLDNFEWKYGWWPRFGLIAVDRKNGMKRTLRPSAKWFSDKLKEIKD
jgi:beta-glucosidase